MAKKNSNKIDIQNGRISVLFFFEVLMCLFLWAERTARYRYDLIFRQILPWLLPVLLAASLIGFLYLLRKGGRAKAEKEALFSPSFGAYLLVMPLLGIALPLLSYFGNGLEQFKLATESAFYLLIGHFAAYLAYFLAKPALGVLAWMLSAESAIGIYFYETQLTHAAGILNAPERTHLSTPASALVHSILLVLVVLVVFLLGKVDRLKLKPLVYLVPTGLWLLFLWSNVLFPFSFTLRKVLLLSVVGLTVVFFIFLCAAFRKKK